MAILPETDGAGAEFLAERICRAIYDFHISHTGSPEQKRLTVSIGVSTTVPSVKFKPLHSIEAADTCLYQAKASSRNCSRPIVCKEPKEEDDEV